MWRNIFAAVTVLALVHGSNAAMAGDFELGIDGSPDEVKIEAKLSDEPTWGVLSILVPQDKDPLFGLDFSFEDKGPWSVIGGGIYDAETEDVSVRLKFKFSW